MASVIARFMSEYSGIDHFTADKTQHNSIATRRSRRREMDVVIIKITAIFDAETDSLDRIPENFRGTDAYAETERIVDALENALDALESVYNS